MVDILHQVEACTGIKGINHVLIQHYRDGTDNIQQHSDKTLDINRETPILNVSFGVTREMFIQNKTDKLNIEKIPLRHGECVVFGIITNQYWLHEVPKDVQLKPHPLFGKNRISFTFRRIDTFVDEASGLVYGQGSPYKTLAQALAADRAVGGTAIVSSSNIESSPPPSSTSPTPTAEVNSSKNAELIRAFHFENRQAELFNWEEVYGCGFTVL